MLVSDFSGVIIRSPTEVVYSLSVLDIQKAIQTAISKGLKICVRGEGHSSLQGVTNGLLVINYSKEAGQLEFISNLLHVSSRTQLKEAKLFAQKKGWKIPVLQHFKTFSVGGSVSVGGLGGESIKFGTQVHHVKALSMVTLDGELRHCSSEENPDLFNFALSGLGQLGIIEDVVYQLVPLLRFGRRCKIAFGSLENMVKWVQNFSTTEKTADYGLDYFFGYAELVSNKFEAFAIVGKDFSTAEEANGWLLPVNACAVVNYWTEDALNEKFMEYEKKVEEFRIYNDYCFTNYKDFVNFVSIQLGSILKTDQLPKDTIFEHLNMITIYPVFPQKHRIPLNYSPGGGNLVDMSFDVGILFKTSCKVQLDTIAKYTEKCLAKCITMGGRPYNYGFVKTTEEQRHSIYGPDYIAFLNLKSKYDPHNLIEKTSAI